MKKQIKSKKLFFVLITDVVLFVLMITALVSKNKKNQPVVNKVALINPDYINKISNIQITEYDQNNIKQEIIISKQNNNWLGQSSSLSKDTYWPCDSQVLANFIETYSSITDLYKIGEKETSWESFSVDEESSVCVSLSDYDGNILSKIYFGSQDTLTQRIAVRTWKSDIVYEVQDDIVTYLKTDSSFWADPFIYPQCITDYSRRQSESLLRRGKLVNFDSSINVEERILKKDFENGAQAIFAIYKNNDDYIVQPFFTSGVLYDEQVKNTISKINYCYSISSWTYERLISDN